MRIALEVCFGETVPVRSGDDVTASVSKFIMMRVLNDYELKEKYAHPTVPHMYKDGSVLSVCLFVFLLLLPRYVI